MLLEGVTNSKEEISNDTESCYQSVCILSVNRLWYALLILQKEKLRHKNAIFHAMNSNRNKA